MDIILFERIYLTFLVLETTTSIMAIAKVQIIKLNVDGSIADKSSLPSCYDEGRIDLVSYKYIKNVCFASGQCNRKEAFLSPKAEVLIHQMCSSQDTCISGRFPSWDLQVLGVDAIQVEYHCLVLNATTSIMANTKVQIIKLNVDGSIADKSSLPSCYDAGRIDLVSYKYIKNCIPGSCNRKETSMSPKAEVLIHEMCSSRDACGSGKFPSWDLQILGVDAIQVEYKCLDHFVTFLDLCTDTSKTVDATIHIRSSSNTLETSKECTCSMTGGPFSVTLNDVRLSTGSGQTCSDASLQLPFHKYTCDNHSENLGSVFNREVDDLTSMYTIRLQTNSKKVLPQIVWMTIRTKKSLKVTCNSEPWKPEPSVTTEPQTVALTDNATVAAEAIIEDSDFNNNSLYAVIGAVSALVCIAALVSGLVLVLIRYRKRRARSNSLVFELDHYSKPEPEEILRSNIVDKVGNKYIHRRDEDVKLLSCNRDSKAGLDFNKSKSEEISRSDIGDKVGNELEDIPRRDEEVKLLPCNSASKTGLDLRKSKSKEIPRSDIGDKKGNKLKAIPRRDEDVQLLPRHGDSKAGLVLSKPQTEEISRTDIGDKVENKLKDKPTRRTDEEVRLFPNNSAIKTGLHLSKRHSDKNLQSDPNHKVKVKTKETPKENEAAKLIPAENILKERTCTTDSDTYYDDFEINAILKEIKIINKKLNRRMENKVRPLLISMILQRKKYIDITNFPI